MQKISRKHIVELLSSGGVLSAGGYEAGPEALEIQPISADGSQRIFFRVAAGNNSLAVGVYPALNEGQNLAEAHSAMAIGGHLYGQKVSVPRIIGMDRGSGLILFEDCGDIRLHDFLVREIKEHGFFSRQAESLYRKVISELVCMQVQGAENFQPDWCYDTARYDREVMIGKESEYFLKAFWLDLLGGDPCLGLAEEFEEIAENAGRGLNGFFLHRDFQSRNIMVFGSDVYFIDFQGGRLGPPGYDLASLLLDPYAGLPVEKRAELLDLYIDKLHELVDFKTADFLKQYVFLELQRNLQILGAFAFLYKVRGKLFFKDYILPALDNLFLLLERDDLQGFCLLRNIVKKARSRLQDHL